MLKRSHKTVGLEISVENNQLKKAARRHQPVNKTTIAKIQRYHSVNNGNALESRRFQLQTQLHRRSRERTDYERP